MARLGDVCESKIDTLKSMDEGYIDYIDISSVDNQKKTIETVQSMLVQDAPSRAKQLVKQGDILLSTVRPNLNAVAMVTKKYDNTLIASTGYCVLRCLESVNKKYVFYFCQSSNFIDKIVSQATGASYPAVNTTIIKNCEIPLPPIDEQRKIAAVLDKVSDLITKRCQQLDKLDLLVKSQFIEMFQNKGYDVVNAGTVMKNMRNGLSPSTSGTCHGKVLTLTAFTQGAFDDTQWKDATFAETPPESKRISASDFYMCRGNGNVKLVGRGVYANQSNENLVFPDTVIAASIDTENICLPYLFMAWQMPDVRDQIEKGARTTNGTYKINQKILSDITLILPPLPEQLKFAEVLQQADKSKFTIQQSLEKLETLKKALMQEYFG